MKKTIDNIVKGAVGLGLMFNLTCSETPKTEISEKPVFTSHSSAMYNSNYYISFKDNNIPFMKAYVAYGDSGETKQMVLVHKSQFQYDYIVPQEALDAGKFFAYAIDNDGNKSGEEQFSFEDGIIIKK